VLVKHLRRSVISVYLGILWFSLSLGLLLLVEVVVVLIIGLSLIFVLLKGINFECLWNHDSMLVLIESGGVVLI
jgi:hypothetical protein